MHIHIRGNEAESRKSQTALAAYSFTLVNERGLRKLLLIGILLFLDPLTISLIFTESARSTWTNRVAPKIEATTTKRKPISIDRSNDELRAPPLVLTLQKFNFPRVIRAP